jgi:hypothetical protein
MSCMQSFVYCATNRRNNALYVGVRGCPIGERNVEQFFTPDDGTVNRPRAFICE